MSDNGDDDDYFNEAFGLQHAANSEKTSNLDRDEDGSPIDYEEDDYEDEADTLLTQQDKGDGDDGLQHATSFTTLSGQAEKTSNLHAQQDGPLSDDDKEGESDDEDFEEVAWQSQLTGNQAEEGNGGGRKNRRDVVWETVSVFKHVSYTNHLVSFLCCRANQPEHRFRVLLFLQAEGADCDSWLAEELNELGEDCTNGSGFTNAGKYTQGGGACVVQNMRCTLAHLLKCPMKVRTLYDVDLNETRLQVNGCFVP